MKTFLPSLKAEARKSRPLAATVLLGLLAQLKVGHLQVRTPEGELLVFGDLHEPPSAMIRFHQWTAASRILRDGDIGFAESYAAGWVDTPDLTALLRLVLRNEQVLNRVMKAGALTGWWYRIKHLFRQNSKRGSRKNIHAHYDIGNTFYRLWLDESWTYSSAWFNGNFDQPLIDAQTAKYQRMIDQLGLKAGDRVLEVGCGWGGFAEIAAKQGIYVNGVTLSTEQLAFAKSRIEKQGLSQFATFSLCDYRDIEGDFDAIVSIEMFEAVGEKYWPTYFEMVRQRLKPGGKAMIQSITIDETYFDRYRSTTDFIQQYIFPGGMLPTPSGFAKQAASYGLQLKDQLNFGVDYAETLRRWFYRFEQQIHAVRQQGFDERFIRIWRLYLCYCEAGFDEGRTDVCQFLLQKN